MHSSSIVIGDDASSTTKAIEQHEAKRQASSSSTTVRKTSATSAKSTTVEKQSQSTGVASTVVQSKDQSAAISAVNTDKFASSLRESSGVQIGTQKDVSVIDAHRRQSQVNSYQQQQYQQQQQQQQYSNNMFGGTFFKMHIKLDWELIFACSFLQVTNNSPLGVKPRSNNNVSINNSFNNNVNNNRKWPGKSSKVPPIVLPDVKLGPSPVFSTEASLSLEVPVVIMSTLVPPPDCSQAPTVPHSTSLNGKRQPDTECFFPPFPIKNCINNCDKVYND